MKRTSQGFSLVELLLAMIVASVLMAMAVPSFKTMVFSSQLTTASNDLLYAISEARSEAMRRNAPTLFCGANGDNPSEGGLEVLSKLCDGEGGVVIRTIIDGEISAELVSAHPSMSGNLNLVSVQPLIFGGSGFGREEGSNAPYSGLFAEIYTAKTETENRRCMYMSAGRSLTTCKMSSSESCPDEEPKTCN